jgi:hypothetical protein
MASHGQRIATSEDSGDPSPYGARNQPAQDDIQTPKAQGHPDNGMTSAAQGQVTVFVDSGRFWEAKISDIVIGAATVVLACFAVLQFFIYRLMHQDSRSVGRAFLFNRGLGFAAIKGIDGGIRGWRFIFNWRNGGTTPARRVFMHTSLYMVDKADPVNDTGDLPQDFDFPDTYGFREPIEQVLLSIGPQGEMADSPKDIDISDLIHASGGRKRIFIYGWAEYTDIFAGTPRHRTEFCFEVIIVTNPMSDAAGTSTFLMTAYGSHNGSEDECHRKAGEMARQVPFGARIWPPPHSAPPAP